MIAVLSVVSAVVMGAELKRGCSNELFAVGSRRLFENSVHRLNDRFREYQILLHAGK